MRNLFSLSLLLLSIQIFAQTPITKQRQLLHDMPITPCSIDGTPIADATTEIGLKFSFVDSIGNITSGSTITHYIVKFLRYDDPKLQSTYNYSLSEAEIKADTDANRRSSDVSLYKYFRISKLDYENGTQIVYKTGRFAITAGALTVPIKLRFDGMKINDFSKDITLSSVAGLKIKDRSRLGGYWIPFAGLGISSVALDSVNTNGQLKSSSDRSAVTITSGIIYETDKGLQISLTGGWDHLSKSESIDWCYNGNFWIGFGVGFSLLSEPSKTTPKEINKQVAQN